MVLDENKEHAIRLCKYSNIVFGLNNSRSLLERQTKVTLINNMSSLAFHTMTSNSDVREKPASPLPKGWWL